MSQSFRQISAELARQIRLVMTDVDGTICDGGEPASPAVAQAVKRLEEKRITVGLVSGRTLPELERMAFDLRISGPIVAENGGVAKLRAGYGLLDLGYSRQPAMEALAKLKSLFPSAIRERADNKDRLIDIVFFADGIQPAELRKHIGRTQLLDSGYVLHLMQAGISKGKTLKDMLRNLPDMKLATDDVLIFGDSLTDLSLFGLFPHSVLVPNPTLALEHKQKLEQVAAYISARPCEKGFIEVADHILRLR